VYREKISGVAARRPQLEKLLRVISEGDVVLVTRLDRLARSTRDLLNILDTISQTGAQFKSLRETWADTRAWSFGRSAGGTALAHDLRIFRSWRV
jgi:DNA invertase Pin-like site-specific DNA recombinase